MGTQFEKPDVYATISQMLELAAVGVIEVVIDRVFPLADVVATHAYAESNSILGGVVVIPTR
ncbi:zinc-binding dehydrogenase [Agrobacterium sp.]|jgi:NADPH:quinone reductase-like Zn-dependent oxidoreductase|uniref:zinc-binding dehydrogenase n=1 Tax=Agrobacterium sp. TaxID=361 RepID=UPI0028A9BCBE|nr:zinc-binding dehydrogenase [Agrobacterium sp.]